MLSSSYGLTQSRYLRLMILASMDALITVPFATYIIVANTEQGVTPWISWDDTHSDYSRVIQVPGFIWKNDYKMARALEVSRWTLVLAAFIFFAFFGFAQEARQHYRLAYRSIARRIGGKTSSGPPNKPSHVYVVQCTSLDSFAHAFSALRLLSGWRIIQAASGLLRSQHLGSGTTLPFRSLTNFLSTRLPPSSPNPRSGRFRPRSPQ
jgi:hypothetical protein